MKWKRVCENLKFWIKDQSWYVKSLCVLMLTITLLRQLMRLLGYLSYRRPAKAQASLRIRALSPEPSLFAYMTYGSRRRVRPKNQTSIPTGWLRMRVWRMSLRRTKSTIISWADSILINYIFQQNSYPFCGVGDDVIKSADVRHWKTCKLLGINFVSFHSLVD